MARPRYTFLKNKNLPDLKWSLLLSTVSLAVMTVLLLLSFFRKGQGFAASGAFGLGGFLLALYSFVTSMRILVRRPEHLRLPAFCTIYAGGLFIGWLSLLMLGLNQ
ncbi:MAG: hypothetical protein PUE47_03500 [Lachnospiraceae bacterium]|nr:hypothetical protein [Lachnospiraceae bacterium]